MAEGKAPAGLSPAEKAALRSQQRSQQSFGRVAPGKSQPRRETPPVQDREQILSERAVAEAEKAHAQTQQAKLKPTPQQTAFKGADSVSSTKFDEAARARAVAVEQVSQLEEPKKKGQGGRPANTSSGTISVNRVDKDLFSLVRDKFPQLTNPKALEAYIAYHEHCEASLPDEEMRRAVEELRKRDNADGTIREELDAMKRQLAKVRTETAVASMASASLLGHWYANNAHLSDRTLEDWLSLTDSTVDVMTLLLRTSAEYEQAVQRAHGRKPTGFGNR